MIESLRMGLSGLAKDKVVLITVGAGQDVLVTEDIFKVHLVDPGDTYWVRKDELRPLTEMETVAAMVL